MCCFRSFEIMRPNCQSFGWKFSNTDDVICDLWKAKPERDLEWDLCDEGDQQKIFCWSPRTKQTRYSASSSQELRKDFYRHAWLSEPALPALPWFNIWYICLCTWNFNFWFFQCHTSGRTSVCSIVEWAWKDMLGWWRASRNWRQN